MALYLPKWIYEPMPYVFMGGGVLVAFKIGGTAAYVSGGILFTAGFIIWMLRRDYRQQRNSERDSRYDSRFTDSRVHDSRMDNREHSGYGTGRPDDPRTTRGARLARADDKKVRKPN